MSDRVSRWLGVKEALSTFWSDLKDYAALGVRVALLFTASVSSFFVGLFVSIGGLDYFLLIDKRSMLASMFVYTAILSSITVIVSFVPLLLTRVKLLLWSTRLLAGIAFLWAVIGPEHVVVLGLLVGCVLLGVWLRGLHRDPLNLITIALLCCLAVGYLRGEHLRDRTPSMVVRLADAAATVPVTVIMSSDQGVLVFEPAHAEPRFYPWARISWIASAPSHGGIGQRLRDWRNAVRGWTGGMVAGMLRWLGWSTEAGSPVRTTPAPTATGPEAKEGSPPAHRPKR